MSAAINLFPSNHTLSDASPEAQEAERRLRSWRNATRGVTARGAYAFDRYSAVVLGDVSVSGGDAWPVWVGDRPEGMSSRVAPWDAPARARTSVQDSGAADPAYGVDWHRLQRVCRYLAPPAPKRTRIASAPVRIVAYRYGIFVESPLGWAVVAACRVES